MNIETSSVNNESVILALDGRLNANTSDEFQTKLTESLKKYKNVILDFAKLVYISSAGLRVLLIGEKTSKQLNGSMMLKNVEQDVMDVLEMTGFADILQIE